MMFGKLKRSGSNVLIMAIAAAFITGLIGLSVAKIHRAALSSLTMTSKGTQAQQYVLNEAEALRGMQYVGINNVAREPIGNSGYFRTITVNEDTSGANPVKTALVKIDSGDPEHIVSSITVKRCKVSPLLYDTTGTNTDGAMSQNAITGAINKTAAETEAKAKEYVEQYVKENIGLVSGVPVGTIISYSGVGVPFNSNGNWLLCSGGTFNADTYPELYKALGTTSLPNLNDDRFLQGSSIANRYIGAGLPNITAYLSSYENTHNGYSGAFYTTGNTGGNSYHTSGISGTMPNNIYFVASRSNGIYGVSATVQPKAYTVKYYIKASGSGSSDSSVSGTNGSSSLSAETNGYAKFPNGIIIAWAKANTTSNSTSVVQKPIAFRTLVAMYSDRCAARTGEGFDERGFNAYGKWVHSETTDTTDTFTTSWNTGDDFSVLWIGLSL